MRYLIVFPTDYHHIHTLTVTLEQIAEDALLMRAVNVIKELKVCEFITVNHKYLVIRIK